MKVGVSGHQHIQPDSSLPWVEATIRRQLQHMRAVTGLSSLAEGTDQIFARIVLDLGMTLEAVIPCADYESAFSDNTARRDYEALRAKATRSCCLGFPKPSEEAFLQAGRQIVELCDTMFFVWNGKPAGGRGGTADIVAYAISKQTPFVWLNPSDCSLKTRP